MKHGHARRTGFSAEYIAWRNMIARCERPSSGRYKSYGARGIRVCDRWRASFDAFLSDVGGRPSTEHSLDRIDVNGNYEKGNCRWVLRKRQLRNTQRTRYIEVRGEKISMADAAERYGVPYHTLKMRLRRGWAVERALS